MPTPGLSEIFKPVYVVWWDASAQPGWHESNQIEEFVGKPPMEIETLGWLVGETEDCISLAMSVCDVKASELLQIPRLIIRNIDYL